MNKIKVHTILRYLFALVWLINGLICKVLNLVPRHQEIVGRILGEECARPLTLTIGLAEIGMAVWILSGIKSRVNSVFQIIVIAVMNILEFILVPDLLLWGRFNIIFAFLFILLIYFDEFHLRKKAAKDI